MNMKIKCPSCQGTLCQVYDTDYQNRKKNAMYGSQII
jgi:hypothetical protein